MTYEREKALELQGLIPKMKDATLRSQAQEYVRGYQTQHPEAPLQGGVATNVAIQGGQAPVAGEAENLHAVEAVNPGVRQAYEAATPKPAPAPPQYPHDFRENAWIAQANRDPAMEARVHARLVADAFENQAYTKWAGEQRPDLPSASKIKGLYREPELLAQKKPMQAVVAPPVYYVEPSIGEFRAAMAPTLGEQAANELDEKSTQFQIWKDAQYAHAYDAAQAQGLGLVRTDFARTTDNERRINKTVGALRSTLGAGLSGYTLGLDKVVTPKTQRAAEEMQQQAMPGAAAVGNIGGMLVPGNLGVGVFGAISKGLSKVPALARLEATAGGRVLGSGLRGSLGAVGVGGVEDASRAAANALQNGDVEELIPDRETLNRTLLRGAIGAPLSMLGEGLGAGAQHQRDILQGYKKTGATPPDVVRNVRTLESAGGGTGFGGVTLGPRLAPIERRANELGVDPIKIAREDVEQSVIDESLGLQKKAIRDIGISEERAAGKEGLPPKQYALTDEEAKLLLERLRSDEFAGLKPQARSKIIGSIEDMYKTGHGPSSAQPIRYDAILVGEPAVPWNVIDTALSKMTGARFKDGKLMYNTAPVNKEAQKALQAFTDMEPRAMDSWAAEELKAANPDTVRIYQPRELNMGGFKGLPPDQVIVVQGKKIDAAEALDQWRALKGKPGTLQTPKGSKQVQVQDSMRQAMRDFIGSDEGKSGAFPRLDSAIRAGESKLAELSKRNEALGLGTGGRIPERGLGEGQRVALRANLESQSPEPEMVRQLNKLAAEGTGDLLGRLRLLAGTKSVAGLRQHFGGSHMTVTPSGLRAHFGGGMTKLRLMMDNVNKALEALPEVERVAIDKKISLMMKNRLAPDSLGRRLPAVSARSIRGGRPGRLGAAYGQTKPDELSPEELTLLEIILQANPEKPKKAANQ